MIVALCHLPITLSVIFIFTACLPSPFLQFPFQVYKRSAPLNGLSMWSCCTLTCILTLWFASLFHFQINAGEFQSISVEPHSTGSRLQRTVLFVATKSSYFFSLKITRSIRIPVKTDNGYFFVFRDKFSYFVNLALLTPFICVLFL